MSKFMSMDIAVLFFDALSQKDSDPRVQTIIKGEKMKKNTKVTGYLTRAFVTSERHRLQPS